MMGSRSVHLGNMAQLQLEVNPLPLISLVIKKPIHKHEKTRRQVQINLNKIRIAITSSK